MKYLISILFLVGAFQAHSQLEVRAFPAEGKPAIINGCEGTGEAIDGECTPFAIQDFVKKHTIKVIDPNRDVNRIPLVKVLLEIGEKGKVKKISIAQSQGSIFNEEALRVVESLPAFTGGPQDFLVPVYFGDADCSEEVVYMSEENKDQETVSDEVKQTADVMPVFPGCEEDEELSTCTGKKVRFFIMRNVTYPQLCVEANIQGRVYVYYEIGTDGKVKYVKIVKGVHPKLDKEVMWLIKNLPQHQPGTLNGEKVTVKYIIPVNFQIG